MVSHNDIWKQIDDLAERHGLTASGLAKLAGLDPTTFNPSKRVGKGGRARWPTTESIAKALNATGESLSIILAPEPSDEYENQRPDRVPLLGLAEAGSGGYFDGSGFPAGQGWEEISLPLPQSDATYALEVSGDSMEPAYRAGDILIVSPTEQIRRGDRVVVKTTDGEVTAKILRRETANNIELHSLNPDHEPRTIKRIYVEWMARIMWASQ